MALIFLYTISLPPEISDCHHHGDLRFSLQEDCPDDLKMVIFSIDASLFVIAAFVVQAAIIIAVFDFRSDIIKVRPIGKFYSKLYG